MIPVPREKGAQSISSVGPNPAAWIRARFIVPVAIAAFLLPSAYMSWRERDMPHFGYPHDDGIYFVTAQSLARGDGYKIRSLPEEPWQTKYPPLLPLGLSLVWRIAPAFPSNLALATLYAWLWLPMFLALAYRIFRDLNLDWRVALALTAAVGLNQHVAHFAMRTQPELMFAVFWIASAALVISRRDSARYAVLAGILAGAAYLTKTAALPMLVAGPLYYAAHRRYRSAAAFAGGMLPAVVCWNLWARTHLAHSTDLLRMYYTDYLGYHLSMVTLRGYPAILAKNADSLLGSLGGLLLGWAATPGIAERIAGVLMVVGTIRHARRVGLNPYHLFAGGYAALLLVWHYPPDERFLLPILPVVLAGLWAEVAVLYAALGARHRGTALAFGSICLLFMLYWGIAGWTEFSQYFRSFRELRDNSHRPAYEWIKHNTSPDKRFLASEDALLYLYTGRKAMTPIVPMRYFYIDDAASTIRILLSRPAIAREHGLDYILDAPRDWWRELLPNPSGPIRSSHAALATSGEVRRVYKLNGCAVYEVPGAVRPAL